MASEDRSGAKTLNVSRVSCGNQNQTSSGGLSIAFRGLSSIQSSLDTGSFLFPIVLRNRLYEIRGRGMQSDAADVVLRQVLCVAVPAYHDASCPRVVGPICPGEGRADVF